MQNVRDSNSDSDVSTSSSWDILEDDGCPEINVFECTELPHGLCDSDDDAGSITEDFNASIDENVETEIGLRKENENAAVTEENAPANDAKLKASDLPVQAFKRNDTLTPENVQVVKKRVKSKQSKTVSNNSQKAKDLPVAHKPLQLAEVCKTRNETKNIADYVNNMQIQSYQENRSVKDLLEKKLELFRSDVLKKQEGSSKGPAEENAASKEFLLDDGSVMEIMGAFIGPLQERVIFREEKKEDRDKIDVHKTEESVSDYDVMRNMFREKENIKRPSVNKRKMPRKKSAKAKIVPKSEDSSAEATLHINIETKSIPKLNPSKTPDEKTVETVKSAVLETGIKIKAAEDITKRRANLMKRMKILTIPKKGNENVPVKEAAPKESSEVRSITSIEKITSEIAPSFVQQVLQKAEELKDAVETSKYKCFMKEKFDSLQKSYGNQPRAITKRNDLEPEQARAEMPKQADGNGKSNWNKLLAIYQMQKKDKDGKKVNYFPNYKYNEPTSVDQKKSETKQQSKIPRWQYLDVNNNEKVPSPAASSSNFSEKSVKSGKDSVEPIKVPSETKKAIKKAHVSTIVKQFDEISSCGRSNCGEAEASDRKWKTSRKLSREANERFQFWADRADQYWIEKNRMCRRVFKKIGRYWEKRERLLDERLKALHEVSEVLREIRKSSSEGNRTVAENAEEIRKITRKLSWKKDAEEGVMFAVDDGRFEKFAKYGRQRKRENEEEKETSVDVVDPSMDLAKRNVSFMTLETYKKDVVKDEKKASLKGEERKETRLVLVPRPRTSKLILEECMFGKNAVEMHKKAIVGSVNEQKEKDMMKKKEVVKIRKLRQEHAIKQPLNH